MSKALVVFSDNTGVWWLKFLKPGFRHCFVILETDRGCIWVDPLSNNFTLKILEGYELAGLIRWYRDMGMHVVTVEPQAQKSQPFALAPMSCVEVVKRLLGIRDRFVLTPWQLFSHLKGTKSENIGKNILTSV
ncbi:hypothetical protein [Terasakiella sp.]|uniref:hypothetical protein n=1 Tax=Terasakiella sp. TaxID=2034861 RepID=UPI003AA91F29